MQLHRLISRFLLFVGAMVPFAALPTAAQQNASPTEGIDSGNYNIQQTIEGGYRFVRDEDFRDANGTRDAYNTFVNLDKGFRLFEHTLQMRSLNHQGVLFDNLYVSSFGYGGDPNDLTRLRVYKNKWYNFNAAFRRDRNYWNYNLLANPLNPVNPGLTPPAGFPTDTITSSPHTFQVTRRISDFNLILLPQSRLRVRLGYSRNISEGPAFSSIHQGTEALLFQNWKTTENAYRVGVDLKFLPRTNISYDQFLNYYKGDTTWQDQSFPFNLSGPAPISNTSAVDLGLAFNQAANQPCGTPISNSTTTPPTANQACNGYLAYNRNSGRPRLSSPTEQLSFQSNYFKNLDMAGRVTYTSGDVKILDFGQLLSPTGQILSPSQLSAGEQFVGFITRTRQLAAATAGPARTERVNVSADYDFTWRLNDKIRLLDTFRYNRFQLPGQWIFGTLSVFPQGPAPFGMLSSPAVFSAATCPPPFTATTCPQHAGSSPADAATGFSSLFFGQSVRYNTVEIEWDATPRVGGRLGYRYGHRDIFESDTEGTLEVFFPTLPNRGDCAVAANCTAQPDGSLIFSNLADPESDSARTTIAEQSALLGIWARPMDTLRVTFDLELLSADRSFTRISPRQLQHYKVRATYKPRNSMSFGAAVNIIENRNNVTTINNLQHNRSYGFSAIFEPNDRFAIDLAYDYNDIFSQTNICFVSSPVTPGLNPIPCPGATALLQALSTYSSTTHFGSANLMFKPIKRVTTSLGYSGSFVNGSTLLLAPTAPLGPLQYNFHKPYASLAVDLVKGLTWKAAWGYYGYNEKANPDVSGQQNLNGTPVTLARDFRGNMVTIAFRYAF
jgi:hypothetical protein